MATVVLRLLFRLRDWPTEIVELLDDLFVQTVAAATRSLQLLRARGWVD